MGTIQKEKKETKKERDARLIRKAQRGCKNSLQELVEQYSNLIWHIANKYTHELRSKDDLYQEGVVSFIIGVQKFDPSRDVALSTYMYPTIHRKIQDHLRMTPAIGQFKVPKSVMVTASLIRDHDLQDKPLEVIMEELNLTSVTVTRDAVRYVHDGNGGFTSADEVVTGHDEYSDETVINTFDGDMNGDYWKERIALDEAVSLLNEKQRKIINYRFNLNMPRSEIAEIFGLTPPGVAYLEKEALKELRISLDG